MGRPSCGLAAAWTALGLLAAGWIFCEPARPARLLAALPQGTVYLGVHDGLGARLPAGFEDTRFRSAAAAFGLTDWPRPLDRPEFRGRLARLFGPRTWVAWSPQFGAQGEPAWVVTTWLGGRAAAYRLALAWLGLPGVSFAGRHYGRAVWEIDTGAGDDAPRLRVCLAEGQLIGVWSRDPGAVAQALDGVDGLAPSLLADRTGRRAELARWAGDAPDQGYYFLPNAPEYGPALWRRGGTPEASFSARVLWPHGGQGALAAGAPDLAHLLGNLPAAQVALPARPVGQMLLHRAGRPVLDELAGLVLTNGVPFVTAALLEGEWAGTRQGAAVPHLLLAMPLAGPDPARRAALDFVTAVNRRLPWAWVAEADAPRPEAQVFALTATGQGALVDWRDDERPAFATWRNWLLLSTHTGALRRLLDRSESPEAAFEAARAPWRAGLDASARGFVHVPAHRLARLSAGWARTLDVQAELRGGSRAPAQALAALAALLPAGGLSVRLAEEAPWLQLDLFPSDAPAPRPPSAFFLPKPGFPAYAAAIASGADDSSARPRQPHLLPPAP